MNLSSSCQVCESLEICIHPPDGCDLLPEKYSNNEKLQKLCWLMKKKVTISRSLHYKDAFILKRNPKIALFTHDDGITWISCFYKHNHIIYYGTANLNEGSFPGWTSAPTIEESAKEYQLSIYYKNNIKQEEKNG